MFIPKKYILLALILFWVIVAVAVAVTNIRSYKEGFHDGVHHQRVNTEKQREVSKDQDWEVRASETKAQQKAFEDMKEREKSYKK